MASTYGFSATGTALTALQAKLLALQWNGAAAFASVNVFDMSNLVVALQELISYANRQCLIVHDVERFECSRKGTQLDVRQRRTIVLLISDRHQGSRQKAMLGDAAGVPPTPGALALKDVVLNGIVGLLEPGMYIEPVAGEQMVLEQKVRDQLQGRVAFSLTLRLVGGNVVVNLGQTPIP
jgi:hypothetical protein